MHRIPNLAPMHVKISTPQSKDYYPDYYQKEEEFRRNIKFEYKAWRPNKPTPL